MWNDLQKTSILTCPRNGIKEKIWSKPQLQRINSQIQDELVPRDQLFLRAASMISSILGLWAWTRSSRTSPTSPMHNLSFTALLKIIWTWRTIWWRTRWVWPVKIFRVTQIKEGIGSTHQGILGTYTTTSGVINSSSTTEHGWQKGEDTNYQRQ